MWNRIIPPGRELSSECSTCLCIELFSRTMHPLDGEPSPVQYTLYSRRVSPGPGSTWNLEPDDLSQREDAPRQSCEHYQQLQAGTHSGKTISPGLGSSTLFCLVGTWWCSTSAIRSPSTACIVPHQNTKVLRELLQCKKAFRTSSITYRVIRDRDQIGFPSISITVDKYHFPLSPEMCVRPTINRLMKTGAIWSEGNRKLLPLPVTGSLDSDKMAVPLLNSSAQHTVYKYSNMCMCSNVILKRESPWMNQ
ncbi:hypothetical protein RRG08_008663 [Elysia crispata]|uniref:Uncharacterized protein n=1 Tax=Elysia crispata TaxID=231223 RepID=A0AAE0XXE8_9GAST|nr:hypothetical protein RRG08_008663 [Elysia crispata]